MNGMLDDILGYKKEVVARAKKRLPLRDLEKQALETEPRRDFLGALMGDGCSLIAEIKTASPSKGIIRDDVDPAEVAAIYAKNGASCISVLTDERYFRGSLDRLGTVREAVDIPLLRKDFIIDEYQLFEARCAGADAVLLIAACLDDRMLADFIMTAGTLDMDCLVEVHTEEEMDRAAGLACRLIGINNRDLKTFRTDISVTGKLAKSAPEGSVIVSESGISTARDVRAVYEMGAKAVLVGEALMRAPDIGNKVRELTMIKR